MKVIGLNTEIENASPLETMYAGRVESDYGFFAEVRDKRDLEIIKKLSERYIELNKHSKEQKPDIMPIENIKGQAFAHIGTGIHIINVKDDSEENIIERLQSISKYGLLACEWFGMRYPLNEVPYCVSFHRINKDCFVENAVLDKSHRHFELENFGDNEKMAFFVDIDNPELLPLLCPYDIFGREPKSWVFGMEHFDAQTIDKQCKIYANSYVTRFNKDLEKLDTIDKNSRFWSGNVFDIWKFYEKYGDPKLAYLLDGDTWEIVDKNKKRYLESAPTPTEEQLAEYRNNLYQEKFNERFAKLNDKKRFDYFQEYLCAIYAGVPSAFISGVALPQFLLENEKFVGQMKTLFPQSKIFGCDGEIYSKDNVSKKQNTHEK